jgi:uncharacterized membrane protein YfcA
MLCVAALLFWRNRKSVHPAHTLAIEDIPRSKYACGCLISTVVGFLSSLLGIGGGIIHVPALIYLLKFPVRVATATSLFVLASSSFVAVCQHFANGTYEGSVELILPIGLGVVLGAQIGAHFSGKVKSRLVVDVLAAIVCLAALKLLI